MTTTSARPTSADEARETEGRPFVSSSCNNAPSGEILAPEGASRTQYRREPPFRRRFLAGGCTPAATADEIPSSASFRRRRALLVVIPSEVPAPAPFSRRRAHSKDGIPSEVPAPARIRRRRAHLVRNSVGNLPSGAVFSPEGALSQLRRTRTSFRRLSLAEGLALAETCNEVSPPASPGNKALGTATSSASQTSRCLPQGPTALHRARCPGATPSPWAKGSRKGSPPP